MSKSLAPAGLAGLLFLPLAAQATEVQVYGRATVELAQYSDQSDVGAGRDGMSMEDNTSGRLGVLAEEEMDDALTGIARFEFQIDTSDGTRDGSCTTDEVDPGTGTTHSHACEQQTVFTPRENIVGLATKYGEFNFGRVKTPYKYVGGVTYDPFTDTALEARGNGGMSGYAENGDFGHRGFLADSMSWRFTRGGMALWLAYSPVEEAGEATSGAFKYTTENWELFYAGYDQGDLDRQGKGTKYGGMFRAGSAKFKAQYESLRAAGNKDTIGFLGIQYQTGNTILLLQGGQTKYADDSTVDYAAAGLIRKFTKQTRMFLGFRQTADLENVYSIGLRKDF